MAKQKYVEVAPEICKDYLSGILLDSISAKFNIPKPSIYSLLHRNNIDPNRGAPRLFTTDDEATIGELYSSGAPMEVLAKKYGCAVSTICLTIQRLGIKARTNRKYHIGYIDFFDAIDTESKAYWAGFITADGCITDNKKSLILTLQTRDGSHIERFIAAIHSDYRVRSVRQNSSGRSYATVQIYDKRFVQGLLKLPGVGPRKTSTIRWPGTFITHNLLRHYLRGYTDGDGGFYIGVRNNRPSVRHAYGVASNFSFISGLQQHLIEACNLQKTKLYKRKDKPDRSWSLKYGGRLQVSRIFSYLYKDATIWLPRKREKIEPYLQLVDPRQIGLPW